MSYPIYIVSKDAPVSTFADTSTANTWAGLQTFLLGARLANLTTNGFVTTTGSNGTLEIITEVPLIDGGDSTSTFDFVEIDGGGA